LVTSKPKSCGGKAHIVAPQIAEASASMSIISASVSCFVGTAMNAEKL
jgi:hypothetical protein